MERAIFVAAGIGALVFAALLATGPSGFMEQRDQLQQWFWVATVTFSALIPLSLIGFAAWSLAITRWVARISVVGFIACQLLWLTAMTVPVLESEGNPWIQGINALPATLAAVAWRTRWSMAVAVSQGPLVTLVQMYASSGTTTAAVLDGLGALLFCSIVASIALAVLRAADAQDQAADRARAQAGLDARRRTEERELSRIDAIVHDDIMSVLLTASKADAPPTLARQAALALGSIADITDPARDAPAEYTASEVIALLRATAADLDGDAHLDYELHGDPRAPSDAVAALSEALGEALRNASRHAGPDAAVRIGVVITNKSVTVAIEDDGKGFSPRAIATTRLGIRVSIVDRMRSVDGGGASVSSRPGRGTRVTLTWRRT